MLPDPKTSYSELCWGRVVVQGCSPSNHRRTKRDFFSIFSPLPQSRPPPILSFSVRPCLDRTNNALTIHWRKCNNSETVLFYDAVLRVTHHIENHLLRRSNWLAPL